MHPPYDGLYQANDASTQTPTPTTRTARNDVTAFAYDARDRLITKTDALLQAESYQYDPAGNLAFVTDRKGQVRGYTYDLLGRMTQAGFGASSTTSPAKPVRFRLLFLAMRPCSRYRR